MVPHCWLSSIQWTVSSWGWQVTMRTADSLEPESGRQTPASCSCCWGQAINDKCRWRWKWVCLVPVVAREGSKLGNGSKSQSFRRRDSIKRQQPSFLHAVDICSIDPSFVYQYSAFFKVSKHLLKTWCERFQSCKAKDYSSLNVWLSVTAWDVAQFDSIWRMMTHQRINFLPAAEKIWWPEFCWTMPEGMWRVLWCWSEQQGVWIAWQEGEGIQSSVDIVLGGDSHTGTTG